MRYRGAPSTSTGQPALRIVRSWSSRERFSPCFVLRCSRTFESVGVDLLAMIGEIDGAAVRDTVDVAEKTRCER